MNSIDRTIWIYAIQIPKDSFGEAWFWCKDKWGMDNEWAWDCKDSMTFLVFKDKSKFVEASIHWN